MSGITYPSETWLSTTLHGANDVVLPPSTRTSFSNWDVKAKANAVPLHDEQSMNDVDIALIFDADLSAVDSRLEPRVKALLKSDFNAAARGLVGFWHHDEAKLVRLTESGMVYLRKINVLPPADSATVLSTWPRNLASSTMPTVLSLELQERICDVFASTSIQDGDETTLTSFVNDLTLIVKSHADEAIEALADLIAEDRLDRELVAEALKAIGEMYDPPTHLQRRRLLERALASKSRYVRDAAGVGLDSLNDPNALSTLRAAHDRERIPGLRQRLGQVIVKLEQVS